VIDVMQTTMISASMTAYSTAVGPSSREMKSAMNVESFAKCICFPPSRYPGAR